MDNIMIEGLPLDYPLELIDEALRENRDLIDRRVASSGASRHPDAQTVIILELTENLGPDTFTGHEADSLLYSIQEALGRYLVAHCRDDLARSIRASVLRR